MQILDTPQMTVSQIKNTPIYLLTLLASWANLIKLSFWGNYYYIDHMSYLPNQTRLSSEKKTYPVLVVNKTIVHDCMYFSWFTETFPIAHFTRKCLTLNYH